MAREAAVRRGGPRRRSGDRGSRPGRRPASPRGRVEHPRVDGRADVAVLQVAEVERSLDAAGAPGRAAARRRPSRGRCRRCRSPGPGGRTRSSSATSTRSPIPALSIVARERRQPLRQVGQQRLLRGGLVGVRVEAAGRHHDDPGADVARDEWATVARPSARLAPPSGAGGGVRPASAAAGRRRVREVTEGLDRGNGASRGPLRGGDEGVLGQRVPPCERGARAACPWRSRTRPVAARRSADAACPGGVGRPRPEGDQDMPRGSGSAGR